MLRPAAFSLCRSAGSHCRTVIINGVNTRILARTLRPHLQATTTTTVRLCSSNVPPPKPAPPPSDIYVEPHEEIIYKAPFSRHMFMVKVFSVSSSAFGIIAQPVLISKAMELGSTPIAVVMCSFFGFFTFVTPLLLHFITRKYVTHIIHNKNADTYSAVTISFLLKEKRVEFTPDDVTVPDFLGMFTTCHIKGKPYLFDMKQFDDPQHYIKIMGYDKPLDFGSRVAVSEDENFSESESQNSSSRKKLK